MSTTSKSRASDRRAASAFVAAALLIGAAGAPAQAPDSPRPAVRKPATGPTEDDSAYRGTVELKSARIRKLDATLRKMAGPAFLERAHEPVAVEVQTARPLPSKPRDTSAVLVINGETFADTWMIQPDRLVAFTDRGKLKPTNTVAAAWSGSEESSATRKPLTFRLTDESR